MPAILRTRQLIALVVTLAAAVLLVPLLPAPPAHAQTRAERVREALDIVRHQRGDDYSYGSAGPGRFDCSGLMYFAFHKAGFDHLPRSSGEQARFSNRIKRSNMKKGDLIFFTSGGSVYHVAIFVGWHDGHRVMIHASSNADRVKRARVYSNSWFPGTLRR